MEYFPYLTSKDIDMVTISQSLTHTCQPQKFEKRKTLSLVDRFFFFFLDLIHFFNAITLHYRPKVPTLLTILIIMDVKSGRFKYQSGRAGDEGKKPKSPAKSGRVGISAYL